jgi:hypothetical protein
MRRVAMMQSNRNTALPLSGSVPNLWGHRAADRCDGGRGSLSRCTASRRQMICSSACRHFQVTDVRSNCRRCGGGGGRSWWVRCGVNLALMREFILHFLLGAKIGAQRSHIQRCCSGGFAQSTSTGTSGEGGSTCRGSRRRRRRGSSRGGRGKNGR